MSFKQVDLGGVVATVIDWEKAQLEFAECLLEVSGDGPILAPEKQIPVADLEKYGYRDLETE